MKSTTILATLVCVAGPLAAQTAADSTAIRQTALDYIEGWYTGNADRMARALHPALAKRIINSEDGHSVLGDMGKSDLVAMTERGGGRGTPDGEQRKDVAILDIFRNAASVKVVARDWVDYLHLGKFDGRWVIINVLWELNGET